jgi:hypothetical protein
MNSFYRTVMDALKCHYPGSDQRCVCGQQRDDWEWADHATDEVVAALTAELGLGAEMSEDNNLVVSRYVTDWRED